MYERLNADCMTLAGMVCAPVYLGPTVGMQDAMQWREDRAGGAGCDVDFGMLQTVCGNNPMHIAECLRYVEEAPEPEPEEPAAACPQVFLGPAVGFVDVMEPTGPNVRKHPSVTSDYGTIRVPLLPWDRTLWTSVCSFTTDKDL